MARTSATISALLLALMLLPAVAGAMVTAKVSAKLYSNVNAPEPAKRVFEIARYPGTIPFNQNPNLERWYAPFGTSLRVYKTSGGEPLETEKVVSFFRELLRNKGWKDDVFKRQGSEGYLGMGIEVFEDLPNKTRIHLSGKFYLWVAPRDGIYTVLLDQWRLSSVNQVTMDFLSAASGSLEAIGNKKGYRVQKVFADGEWGRDFENEFLIDRVRFSFIAKDASSPHSRDGQSISLLVLTYRDPQTAEEESRRFLQSSAGENIGNQTLSLPSKVITLTIVKNTTVFVIQDNSGKQADIANLFAAELRKL